MLSIFAQITFSAALRSELDVNILWPTASLTQLSSHLFHYPRAAYIKFSPSKPQRTPAPYSAKRMKGVRDRKIEGQEEDNGLNQATKEAANYFLVTQN